MAVSYGPASPGIRGGPAPPGGPNQEPSGTQPSAATEFCCVSQNEKGHLAMPFSLIEPLNPGCAGFSWRFERWSAITR